MVVVFVTSSKKLCLFGAGGHLEPNRHSFNYRSSFGTIPKRSQRFIAELHKLYVVSLIAKKSYKIFDI